MTTNGNERKERREVNRYEVTGSWSGTRYLTSRSWRGWDALLIKPKICRSGICWNQICNQHTDLRLRFWVHSFSWSLDSKLFPNIFNVERYLSLYKEFSQFFSKNWQNQNHKLKSQEPSDSELLRSLNSIYTFLSNLQPFHRWKKTSHWLNYLTFQSGSARSRGPGQRSSNEITNEIRSFVSWKLPGPH